MANQLSTFLAALLFCSTNLLLAAPSAKQLLESETKTWITAATLPESKETATFTQLLLSSVTWQRELADSGPVEKPEKVIQLLYELWKSDPALHTRPIDRAMATACALEGPRRDWNIEQMLPRYQYFKTKNDLGLLNTVYKDLNVFQRRYLARGVQHGHLNGIESMEYQNIEVCLPAERYTGACWYARWILLNPFGDTIHGPKYYQPYRQSWNSAAEMIRNVGGVCGSLSNFGAAAAIANGVPGVTMGEPGHCAYAIMMSNGNWSPAYSLNWKRGLHTTFFNKGSWGWHVYLNNSMKSPQKASEAADLRRLAQHYLTEKQNTRAYATLEKARQQHPQDWSLWESSAQALTETKAPPSIWQDLHNDTLKHLAPVAPEIAWNLLASSIYKHVLPDGENQAQDRYKILLAYEKAITGWGLARWDFDSSINQQLKLLKASPELEDKFMSTAFALHVDENILTPVILETQLKRTAKDENRRVTFIKNIGQGLSKNSSDGSNDVIETLAKKILPDAAAQGDKATFQFIGKLTAKTYKPNEISPEPFPGILLSSGGTLAIDKPNNRYDNAAKHWGVIETHGGDFHTGSDKPHVTVQLGNYGLLSGVVIVTRDGHIGRLNGAILETSIDGQDWKTIHTFNKAKRINRILLADQKISAGYIRVTHPGGQPLHFNKFLTYGKKQN